MNVLKKVVYALFFITTVASAQVKRVQFVSDENQLPLSDVEVYDGNSLIGKSDPNGYFDVKTGDSNYLRMTRGDYQDVFIKVADLQERVILVKKKPVELQEVVIGKKLKLSVRKILKSIRANLLDYSPSVGWVKYRSPDYYNLTNILLMETDTLHYLNGLINHEIGKEFQYGCRDRIGKNFHSIKKSGRNPSLHGSIYYVDNKQMTFRTDWLFGEWHIDFLNNGYYIDTDYVLVYNILEKRKNYHYTVSNIGNFYKVEFVNKNKSPFGFNGYIIVDKTDFGIYEFKAHLVNNMKNNDKSILLPSNIVQIYHLTDIDYYSKLQKDKDGIYHLIGSYCDKQFEQTQGNFRGKKFSYSSKIEATDNYKNVEFINFNLATDEVK